MPFNFSTFFIYFIRTLCTEANNALLYSRRTDDVCESMSVVKPFKKAPVAFSRELRYCFVYTSRRRIEDIRDKVYKGEPSFIHSFNRGLAGTRDTSLQTYS